MDFDFKNYLLEITTSTDCREVAVIQSLWSDYGKIARYQLVNSSLKTVVVKHISPPRAINHPRGWHTAFSHERKVKSYQVETLWYQNFSEKCQDACKIPIFLGSYSQGNEQWIVLEDLDVHFPARKQQLGLSEVKVCLKWLANFHSTYLGVEPGGLWKVGTYWHLATRPEELEKIQHKELKIKAYQIDEILNNCKYQTIVHGDAKLANFCFSENGNNVAAVDFQYVGGGCGMKDVAYFLGSCLSSSECEKHENALLDFYFKELENGLQTSDRQFNFRELEHEWRSLYPVACTDFTRFLLGWMPSHQKINNYNFKMVKQVLASLK